MPVRNSLPRRLSLKSRVQIAHLLRTGRRVHGQTATVVWLPSDSFAFGIFLSRKHGAAHERNRIKRLYREAIRQTRQQLALPVTVGLLPRIEAKTEPVESIRSDVSKLFQRINHAHAE